MALKIFFVMRTAAHFAYHATTIDHLAKRGHAITLLFDPKWNNAGGAKTRSDALEEWLATGPRVEIRDAISASGFWRNILSITREARSYAHYCRRGEESQFYRERWKDYLPERLQRFTSTRIGSWVFRQRLTQRVLTVVERLAPADRAIVAALRHDKPDCVIASPINMRFDEEVDYIKAARVLKIPSAVPVLSWDNLTTKGLFHVTPDLVLAWHQGHRTEAREIHGVPSARIAITGSPFFDKWFDASRSISSRTATCQRINVDPARPYVLYLGSSGNIIKKEAWVVIALVSALQNSDDRALRRLQVVFKPHPANLRSVDKLDRARVPVWPREYGLPDTAETIGHFRDMLYHAASVIGINTTGMVDAVICNRPCVALTVEECAATQTDATHFQRMAQSRAFYLADSVEHAVKLLGKLLTGQDRHAALRRKFVETYARPRGLGADAGEAAALTIEHLVKGVRAADIVKLIDRELANRPAPRPPVAEPESTPLPSGAIHRSSEKARKNAVFRHYEYVRDIVLGMMDEGCHYTYSSYWKQETNGFAYMFEASPLVIAKLREHTYHITGLRPYEYREHHAERAAGQFAWKLERLQEVDSSHLFVPEAPELGGFGHRINGDLVNLDTLKFYECLIALDRAGIVSQLRTPDKRHRVLEVGAGWGGLAYQLKTLVPNLTYIIVDLPPTLLFSATYLRATFPNARMKFYGDEPDNRLLADIDQTDFVFIPAHAFGRLRIPPVDIAVNVASFQEMTTQQVTDYVQKLADSGCPRLYSLNRDRSRYNPELSTVTEAIATRYRLEQIHVLPVSYTVLSWKPGKIIEPSAMDYKHQIGLM